MAQPFDLTPKQIEARDTVIKPSRHALLYGGARSTKTFIMCFAIATRAIDAPGSRHLVARLHNIDVRQKVMLDTWRKMMRLAYPEVAYTLNRSDQVAIFDNESEVWFSGLDTDERVEKVLGSEFATIFANECSQLPFATIVMARTRLAQAVRRRDGRQLPLRFLYDLNPVGRSHWTHKEFIEGVNPETHLPLSDEQKAQRRCMVMNPQDNPHLPAETLEELASLPTRARQRFFLGQYLSEVPGALWPMDWIDALRVGVAPKLTRVVVAVDPSGSDGSAGDAIGIVVAGKGEDGDAYILADRTCRLPPGGWAMQVANAYGEFAADKVVAEVNYGGAMVESTIKLADPNIAYKQVTASRGKHVRAEPIAGLYETVTDDQGKITKRGRVHHVGTFPELEEEMGFFTTAGYQGSGSPNRADAAVWALSELMLGPSAQGWLDYYEKLAKEARGEAVG